MNIHLTEKTIDRYIDGTLEPTMLIDVDDHIAACEACALQVREAAGVEDSSGRVDVEPLAGEPDHPGYSRLAAFFDRTADEIDREIVEMHLWECGDCRKQLNAFAVVSEMISADLATKKPVPIRFGDRLRAAFAWRFAPEFATAFTFLLVASVGLVWLLQSDKGPERASIDMPVSVVETQPTAPIELPSEPVAEASPETRTEIRRNEPLKPLSIPAEVRQLRQRSGVLMSGGTSSVPFALAGPTGRVVLSDRPQFDWSPLEGAEYYTVQITHNTFNIVASSGPIKATNWVPDVRLERGKTYTWQVTAIREGKEMTSPVRPAPDARFMVADSTNAAEIERLKRRTPNDHIGLGIAYAQAGLLVEAESEFRRAMRQKQTSETARKYLAELQKAAK